MDNNVSAKLNEVLRNVTQRMGFECRVDLGSENRDGQEIVTAALYVPEHGRVLIGKNGQNLRALEHLVRLVFGKMSPEYGGSVLLDINDYRKTRATQVLEIARQVVMKVRNTQKAEALVPMSAYERRVVHMELAAHPDIVTESVGEEPQRRIIIKPFP